MKTRVLLLIAIVAGWPTVVGAQHAAPLTPQDSALHVLNRLAYGPRPGEIERVARAGVLRWIAAQLAPDKIDDQIVARREREFDVLKSDRGDLARLYAEVQRARQERKRMDDTAADLPCSPRRAIGSRRTPCASARRGGSTRTTPVSCSSSIRSAWTAATTSAT